MTVYNLSFKIYPELCDTVFIDIEEYVNKNGGIIISEDCKEKIFLFKTDVKVIFKLDDSHIDLLKRAMSDIDDKYVLKGA